ncbi:MAG TPA: hypothetical protein VFS34_17265, partial [Thermoanaerobaculia bacterium]|nr:hypothetical protein [Thermoanaerobaculia bacterium]
MTERRPDPRLVPAPPATARRRPVLGIMGAGEKASPRDVQLAEELGELAARAGWIVLTGGRDTGIMDAALRGAKGVEG